MIILFGLYYSRCIKLEIKLDMGDIDIRSSYKDDLPMLYRTFNQTARVFLAMIVFCLIACAQSSYAQSIRYVPVGLDAVTKLNFTTPPTSDPPPIDNVNVVLTGVKLTADSNSKP